MVSIRKKTSNRGTTHQRSKIKQKAAETRKKNKKAARKDVTWKSNKTKDPGIPNSFPYKDQILAEVAEQRRQAEEEKIRAKEERKAAKQEAAEQAEAEEVDQPGVSKLSGDRVLALPPKTVAAPVEEEDESAPLLFDASIPTLQAALEQADVLLEVVDARDPLGFRSPWLEEQFLTVDEGDKRKLRVVVVLTKIDLAPKEALIQWLNYLRPRFPTVLFKSSIPASHVPLPRSESTVEPSLAPSESLGREELMETLQSWAEAKRKLTKKGADSEEFVVAVAGLPNVGKSSMLNTLLQVPASSFPVATYPPNSLQHGPTTTTPTATTYTFPSTSSKKSPLEIKFIDTPGWIFADVFPGDNEDSEDEADDEDDEGEDQGETEEEAAMWDLIEVNRIKDLLRRNIGRIEKIKEPFALAEYLITHSNANDLVLLYGTPSFLPNDSTSFLTGLARVTGRMKKHGTPDLDSAAKLILRDWALGQFPHYSLPPKNLTLEPTVPANLESIKLFTKREEDVLARLRTRREFMSEKGGRGIVKMVLDETFEKEGGDQREIVLDDEIREDEDESEGEGEWSDEEDELDGDEDEVMKEDEPEEDEEDDEDPAGPSALDVLLAANPSLLGSSRPSSKKSSKLSAASVPVPSLAKPSKKTSATPASVSSSSKNASAAKRVVFAAEEKGKTPNGDSPMSVGKGPRSILKTQPAAVESAPAVVAVAASKGADSSAKGKKRKAAAASQEEDVVTAPSKKEKREQAKAAASVEKIDKKVSKVASAAAPKTTKAAKAAPTPAEVKMDTKSKAAERAKDGEQGYDFNKFFF